MDLMAEIEMKINLITEGLRVEPAAMEGVGTLYKEDLASVFDFDTEEHDRFVRPPAELRFPIGTTCCVLSNNYSPYRVRKEDGTLVLEKNGKFLTTIEWLPRPAFYGKTTSDGTPMWKIAQMFGQCCFMMSFSNYCINWEDGLQCLYCNINAAQEGPHKDEVLITKRPQEFAEVAAEALKEGIVYHWFIIGGTLVTNQTAEVTTRICEALRSRTGLQLTPLHASISPPKDLTEIDRMRQSGLKSIEFNLEVWSRDMFKIICPGKEKNLGRELYEEALEYAVSSLGRGNVCTVIVCGLENKEKYYEACHALSEKGVVPHITPWIPMVGSRLEGHRNPKAEWYLEVNSNTLDIIARNMPELLTEEYYRSGHGGTCHRSNVLAIYWDEIRRRLGGIEIETEQVHYDPYHGRI